MRILEVGGTKREMMAQAKIGETREQKKRNLPQYSSTPRCYGRIEGSSHRIIGQDGP